MNREALSFDRANELARQAYNQVAANYHALFHDELDGKPYDQELLVDFIRKLEPKSWILDAGCGPSGHVGGFLLGNGFPILGADISEACVALAKEHNPGLHYVQSDMSDLPLGDASMGGVISYYTIIHCPKRLVPAFFDEFHRVLKPGGCLLIAVKAGTQEALQHEVLGVETEIWFSLFSEAEIRDSMLQAGFAIEFLERRDPYRFEIENARIFAIGRKIAA
jgi:SAM-dependent methyltransferase